MTSETACRFPGRMTAGNCIPITRAGIVLSFQQWPAVARIVPKPVKFRTPTLKRSSPERLTIIPKNRPVVNHLPVPEWPLGNPRGKWISFVARNDGFAASRDSTWLMKPLVMRDSPLTTTETTVRMLR